jgi:hypothetical protein
MKIKGKRKKAADAPSLRPRQNTKNPRSGGSATCEQSHTIF